MVYKDEMCTKDLHVLTLVCSADMSRESANALRAQQNLSPEIPIQPLQTKESVPCLTLIALSSTVLQYASHGFLSCQSMSQVIRTFTFYFCVYRLNHLAYISSVLYPPILCLCFLHNIPLSPCKYYSGFLSCPLSSLSTIDDVKRISHSMAIRK